MRALGKGDGDWNIVQNNGMGPELSHLFALVLTSLSSGITAAQVVPHVHYHIIPRGEPKVPEIKARSWAMFGKGQRDELDDEEGVKVAALIRQELRKDLEAMADHDTDGHSLLSKL